MVYRWSPLAIASKETEKVLLQCYEKVTTHWPFGIEEDEPAEPISIRFAVGERQRTRILWLAITQSGAARANQGASRVDEGKKLVRQRVSSKREKKKEARGYHFLEKGLKSSSSKHT